MLNDTVRATDRIITDATGKARILFHDDGAVSLGSNTSLDLIDVMPEGDAPVFKAHVAQGMARFITGKIVERNPKGFSVSTPEGTAGIRGTIFALQTGNGRTTIYVANATRDVVLNGVSVPSGFKMTLPGGSPVRMTPEDVSFTQSIAAAPPSSTQENAPAEQAVAAVLKGNDAVTPTAALADLGLATQSLGDSLVPQLTALVQGTLTPASTGAIGADILATDFSGNFSFNVDLGSGAITNGAMAGSSALFAIGNGGAYILSGGNGSMSNGSFSITGFSGTITYPISPISVGAAGPSSYMTGSGSIGNVGDTVSGNYYIDSTPHTGWTIDEGTFSGSRTQ
ncbi:MAG: FecR family protein [Desulfovibrio sp.]|nr:FecR family protein [Desulfovibrio sp.]